MLKYVSFLAAVILLAAASSCPGGAEPMNTYKSGNFEVSYTGNGLALKYKGVSIIRRSSLYVVSPGWTKLLFGHHITTPKFASEDVPGGKQVKVSLANDAFAATYTITMFDNDVVAIDLGYRLLKDEPAEMEYCLGYFSAPILADAPFEAETVEGHKSGTVPHTAKSSDQHESMLVPAFDHLKIDSRLAAIDMQVSGVEKNMVIFDARRDPQPWAREAPVFWCGLGVPARPIKYDVECHSVARLTFTPRADSKAAPEIEAASADIIPIKDARLPADRLIQIIPEPKSADFTDGDFTVTPETAIVLPDQPTADDRFAAGCLTEELHDIYGIAPRVITAGEVTSGKGIIVIGEPSRNSVLARMCKETGLQPPAHEEGYAIKSCPSFVLVAGTDTRGTFYGVQTLLQLLKPTTNGASVQGGVVNDWPTMKIRGAHVFVGNESRPFLEKMIHRIFARYKLNYLCVQADYSKWDSAPGIWLPWSTSKEDLKAIAACARQHHMEVVPLVQSLGHSEWAFKNNQNLDIAEDPDHPYAFCPSNPKYYDFIFKIYDEAMEVFHPTVFHIGHDEVTMEGHFQHDEQCKQKTVTELFLSDVNKLHDYFAKKGVKVMLWGDMLLHKSETPDAGTADSVADAKVRREALPKDVIIADWHYCPSDDFPSVKTFKDLGHEVIASTWYTPQNIEDFSRSAKKDGAEGLMETLWAGYHISEQTVGEQFQQFHAYILAAEYAWNTGQTKLNDLNYTPAEEFTKQWKHEKADHSAKDGFIVDLTPFANMPLTGSNSAWLGYGTGHDMQSFKTGRVRLNGIDFSVPDKGAILLSGPMNPAGHWPGGLKIPIGRKADGLVFLMASGWHSDRGASIGKITIHYSPSESMVVALVYGENIAAWNDYLATPSALTAWIGKTQSGDKAIVRTLDWRNPCPDKEIQSIEITSSATEASPILFAVTGLSGPK